MDYSKIKYMHVERLLTEEVEDLLVGNVYVFPKIDGTNGVVWCDNGVVKVGNRNRVLSIGFNTDNGGFCEYITAQENIKKYFEKHPNRILYGEWLIPHTIKTYRDDCWHKFYVFDVGIMSDGERTEYLPYETYKVELDEFGIDYLAPLKIVKNPDIIRLREIAETNFYLLKDGSIGEGVVCKNYEFYNKYGRQTWGKLVRNAFKESHHCTMGAPVENCLTIEEQIVNEYVTKHLVDKEFEKIKVAEDGWQSKFIPRLLHTVYYSLVTEEMWAIVKEYKNPTIHFKFLPALTTAKIKELRPDIFVG